jgi:hypothetical protein
VFTCAESSVMCFQHESNKNELCVLDLSLCNFGVYAYWSEKKPDKRLMYKMLAKENTASIKNSFNFYFVFKIILCSLDSVGFITMK